MKASDVEDGEQMKAKDTAQTPLVMVVDTGRCVP
jgi:hypothetical protein